MTVQAGHNSTKTGVALCEPYKWIDYCVCCQGADLWIKIWLQDHGQMQF